MIGGETGVKGVCERWIHFGYHANDGTATPLSTQPIFASLSLGCWMDGTAPLDNEWFLSFTVSACGY